MGVLEVSRSIGDGAFKMHGVSSTPDVKKCQLTADDRSYCSHNSTWAARWQLPPCALRPAPLLPLQSS